MLKHLSLALLLIASNTAFAAGWYDVELLVFSRDSAYTKEQIYSDNQPPDMSNTIQLQSNGSPLQLGKNTWKLGGENYTLRTKAGFTPLYHSKWRQYLSSKSRTPRIAINHGALTGRVGVAAGRFLHIDLDVIDHSQGNAIRFKAKRRMKRNEIHYLDHPKMGAFVRVSRSPKS